MAIANALGCLLAAAITSGTKYITAEKSRARQNRIKITTPPAALESVAAKKSIIFAI